MNLHKKRKFFVKNKYILPVCVLIICLSGCAGGAFSEVRPNDTPEQPLKEASEQPLKETSEQPIEETELPLKEASEQKYELSLSAIPSYSGSPYVELEGNIPAFTTEEITTDSFEEYSELDGLGRCGTAYANICPELMPEEEREGIGHIRPSGWHTVKYPEVIKDNYLYNRCHLIGFQLAGENANEKNLITGTRYFNVEGMLPFEERVAEYVQETGNHVLYRVTPVYDGDNLVANGVEMEAWSVEDSGEGICFHVFVYNVQPGIEIDYATGESRLDGAGTESEAVQDGAGTESEAVQDGAGAEGGAMQDGAGAESEAVQDDASENARGTDVPEQTYILNTNTKKFHRTGCGSADQIKQENKEEFTGTRDELIGLGYEPCGNCNP